MHFPWAISLNLLIAISFGWVTLSCAARYPGGTERELAPKPIHESTATSVTAAAGNGNEPAKEPIHESAETVVSAPVAKNPRLFCEAHGGDGDHVPLSLFFVFSLELTNPNDRDVVVEKLSWSTELATKRVGSEMLNKPFTLQAWQTRPIRYLRIESAAALIPWNDGVDKVEDRSDRVMRITLHWQAAGSSQIKVQAMAVRWWGCFEPKPKTYHP